MWVRDAAYVGLALLQMGHAEKVRSYIPNILAAQEADGRVPPIQGDDIPWDDEEWDAQGQTIFLATTYYRYTDEIDALEAWYPAVRAAADFIIELRAGEGDSVGPAAGLLPPSKSAEDLGPEDRHYYWDDFWSVAGLEEAAYAARVLGELEDAERFDTEADDLREAILDSVQKVMGDEPPYVPGAVEDTESSAMARGTVPALWPVKVLSPDSALMERSFDAYHERWIAPDSGGFRHRQGQFWPYGGLELAHAYLRLGRDDVLHEILGWTLSHQTLPGTYAWAEQVDPERGGISGGDMPHAWAAASFATLVREMIVTEQDGHLELFTGVPTWWFEGDRNVTLEEAPTHFGALRLHTEGTIQATDEGWSGVLRLTLSGAKPPGGFRWHMPYEPTSVEGPPGVAVEEGRLTVPESGGTVRLSFSTAAP
jgi:glycogen debranching enzyme